MASNHRFKKFLTDIKETKVAPPDREKRLKLLEEDIQALRSQKAPERKATSVPAHQKKVIKKKKKPAAQKFKPYKVPEEVMLNHNAAHHLFR